MHSQTNQPEHTVELFQTSISFKSSFSQHFFSHSGLQFSTKDADNDLDNSIVSDPCAVRLITLAAGQILMVCIMEDHTALVVSVME